MGVLAKKSPLVTGEPSPAGISCVRPCSGWVFPSRKFPLLGIFRCDRLSPDGSRFVLVLGDQLGRSGRRSHVIG